MGKPKISTVSAVAKLAKRLVNPKRESATSELKPHQASAAK